MSLAAQSDGKILAGGYFDVIGGATRHNIARLTNMDVALQDLRVSPNGSTVTWLRSLASPELWRVIFEESSNGVSWTSLGDGTKIRGGWQLTGISPPISPNRYVRARGYATGGDSNGSESQLESVRMFYLNAHIVFVSAVGTCNGNNPCIHHIRDGIASAPAPPMLNITQEVYAEDIILSFDELITLQGGWNTDFTSDASFSTIQGSITIANGTMILDNIILK